MRNRLFCVFAVLIGMLLASRLCAQHQGSVWIAGNGFQCFDSTCAGNSASTDSGLIEVNFARPTDPFRQIYTPYSPRIFNIRLSFSSVADSLGNLQFYTNGWLIYRRDHSLMPGGNDLFLQQDTSYYHDFVKNGGGNMATQSVVIIPFVNAKNKYHVITHHLNWRSPGPNEEVVYAPYLLHHVVDMTADSGRGAVVVRCEVLTGPVSPGMLQAVRHANGRDWWLMVPAAEHERAFWQWLITPAGMGPATKRPYAWAQGDPALTQFHQFAEGWFTEKGDQFICNTVTDDYPSNIEVYDFDRCTGDITANRWFATVPPSRSPLEQGYLALAVSPSGRFVYITSADSGNQYLCQIDLHNPDPEQANQRIAVTVPGGESASGIGFLTPGPDGKIYSLGTDQFSGNVRVIQHPDSLGKACGYVQSVYTTSTVIGGTLPNNPHYRLGALKGSGCDTLGLPAAYLPPTPPDTLTPDSGLFVVGPNPVRTTLQIRWGQSLEAIEVYDVTGRLVICQVVAPDQREASVAVGQLATATYICRAIGGGKPLYHKLILVVGG